MFSCKARVPAGKRLRQTLCFYCKDGEVRLGEKIGGKDFGRGRFNGYGGDVKPGETIEQAARREFKEESGGSEILTMEKRAVIEFYFESEPGKIREVHVFWVSDCTSEPVGSEEMTARKFFLSEIEKLYERMWAGDRLWLPMFFEGKKLRGRVLYDSPKSNKVLKKQFWEVEAFT